MIAFLDELKQQHNDDASIKAFNEIKNQLTEKKFGLVFEDHTEEIDELLQNNIPVFCADETRRFCKDETLPWNFIIEGDNLQALYLLEKTHKGGYYLYRNRVVSKAGRGRTLKPYADS